MKKRTADVKEIGSTKTLCKEGLNTGVRAIRGGDNNNYLMSIKKDYKSPSSAKLKYAPLAIMM